MIIKPKYLETDIWANTTPDPAVDVMEPFEPTPPPGEDGKDYRKAQGWRYGEKPPYNFVNWMEQHKDAMLVYLNQAGIPFWDADTEYRFGAITIHENEMYYSKLGPTDAAPTTTPNKGNIPVENPWASTPVTDINWGRILRVSADNVVRESTGPADADKLVMTHSDGKIHHTLMSLGILQFRGGIDITVSPAMTHPDGTPLETGDIFVISNDPSDTYHADFHPLSGQGHLGEGIIVEIDTGAAVPPLPAEVKWYRIGAGLNDTYLIRDGHLPMVDITAQGGGNGRLILAHSDAISALEATPKQYTDDTFIWKTGATNGVMTGDLTLNTANINVNTGDVIVTTGKIELINTASSTITSSNTGMTLTSPSSSLNIKTELTFNTDRVLLDTYALMTNAYDMETNPTNYDDLNLTSKGYVDDRFETLITWPKEQGYDAVTQDQTDFVINASLNNTSFDQSKVNVYIEGIRLRRGTGYGFTVQDLAPTIGYQVVLENGVDLGSWVLIEHT